MTDLPKDESAEQEFFYHIGRAITCWAVVDDLLFGVCAYALGAPKHKCALVFYRSPQMGDHVALTDSLVKVSVRPKHLRFWKAIKAKLDTHLPVRNELAHYGAMQYQAKVKVHAEDQPDGTRKVIQTPLNDPPFWALHPPPTKVAAGKVANPRFIVANAVHEHEIHVWIICEELERFLKAVPKKPLTRPLKRAKPKNRRSQGLGPSQSHEPSKRATRRRASRA